MTPFEYIRLLTYKHYTTFLPLLLLRYVVPWRTSSEHGWCHLLIGAPPFSPVASSTNEASTIERAELSNRLNGNGYKCLMVFHILNKCRRLDIGVRMRGCVAVCLLVVIALLNAIWPKASVFPRWNIRTLFFFSEDGLAVFILLSEFSSGDILARECCFIYSVNSQFYRYKIR